MNAFLQAADTQVQDKFNFAIADWMLDAEREKDESKGGRWKPKGPAEGAWVIEIRGWTDYGREKRKRTVGRGARSINRALLRNLQRTDTFAQQTDKDGGKVGKYIVGAQDPVKGRISHAFVYNVFSPNPDPQPGQFLNITRGSFLDALLTSGGSGAGGMGGGPGGPPPGVGGSPSGGMPSGSVPPPGMGGGEGGPGE